MTRDQILEALQHWINQRPGLEFGNYGDVKAYRSEMRRITRQKHEAQRLLDWVRWHESIGVDQLKTAFRAYSGRLTLHSTEDSTSAHTRAQGCRLEYCTGQYWPTEYRAAAAAVLASAVWDFYRDQCMPDPLDNDDGPKTYPHPYRAKTDTNGVSGGDWLRLTMRREFGRTLQSRWLD
jgi:hypothetical protein